MDSLVGLLVGTVVLAAIYSLIGLGLVLVFRATHVLNFAGGALGLAGTYLVYALDQHLSFPVALVLGAILAMAGGAVLYLVLLLPMSGVRGSLGAATDIGVVLGTIVLAALIEALMPFIFGSADKSVDSGLSITPHGTGSFVFNVQQIVIVAVALVVTLALVIGLRRTAFGLRMRAVADEPSLAAYFGIRVGTVAALAWGLAAGVSTLGMTAFAAQSTLNPVSSASLGVALFPAVLIGGLDSIGGMLVGALVLAASQSLAGLYLGGAWVDVAPYGLLLILLAVRPYGFFGKGELVRL